MVLNVRYAYCILSIFFDQYSNMPEGNCKSYCVLFEFPEKAELALLLNMHTPYMGYRDPCSIRILKYSVTVELVTTISRHAAVHTYSVTVELVTYYWV